MFKKFLVGVLAVLGAFTLFVACGTTVDENTSEKVKEETTIEEQKNAALEGEIEESREYGYPKFTGLIKNTSGRELSYVEIKIILYSKDDVQLDTVWTNATDLKADASWKFEGTSIEEGLEYDYYEYEITAY